MKFLCTHVLPKRLRDVGTSGIVVLVISPARKCNSVQEPSGGGCSSPVSSDHNVCACMFLYRECILKLSWFVQPNFSILSRRKSSFHAEHCSGHSQWISAPIFCSRAVGDVSSRAPHIYVSPSGDCPLPVLFHRGLRIAS